MLKPAGLYRDALMQKMVEIAFDDKYKYYYPMSWRDKFEIADSTWNVHQFVSVDKDDNIIGYLAYSIDRDAMVAYSLAIMNFGEPSVTFGRDLLRLFDDIFTKFKFRKAKWTAVVGNPIIPSYDRLCDKLGGRVVGFYEKNDRLMDGTYADRKLYELMAENYVAIKVNK